MNATQKPFLSSYSCLKEILSHDIAKRQKHRQIKSPIPSYVEETTRNRGSWYNRERNTFGIQCHDLAYISLLQRYQYFNSRFPKCKDRKTTTSHFKGHKWVTSRITFLAIKDIEDKRCAIEVFKCVNGLASNSSGNYFCKQNYSKGTRGNNADLIVPPIRTEAARKIFCYQGTQIYKDEL